MAVVGLQPISLRDAVLTIAADDFTAAVGEVSFVPEVDYEWLPVGFGGYQVPAPSGTRWVAMIGYAQDVDTPGGLTRYLLGNAGQVRAVVFTPRAAGAAQVSADVLIIPGKVGGTAGDGPLVAQVTLPVLGDPVMV